MQRAGYKFNRCVEILKVVEEFEANLEWNPDDPKIIFRKKDITDFLYTDNAGNDASLIAKNPLLRSALLPLQRKLTRRSKIGAIVDGRDIGTVVFPDAHLKIFMTASVDKRASRRLAQLQSKNAATNESIESVRESIIKRDLQDSKRGAAPLTKPKDAIELDTSDSFLNPF